MLLTAGISVTRPHPSVSRALVTKVLDPLATVHGRKVSHKMSTSDCGGSVTNGSTPMLLKISGSASVPLPESAVMALVTPLYTQRYEPVTTMPFCGTAMRATT